MASLAQLQGVAEKNRPKNDTKNQGLMQNAVVKKNTGVELHGQSANEHSYAAGKEREVGPQRLQNNNKTIVEENAGNVEALQNQTEVMQEQSAASQKQTGILDKQSGLMQEQIQATRAVSDVVNRLYQFMKDEKSRPAPKVQNFGQGKGHTYGGEFKRVPDGDGNPSLLDSISEMRRERARKQPRDKRGRFKKKKGWKLPKSKTMLKAGGKLLKVGGILGGGLMAADGLNDIANNEGKDLLDGGLSSRGSGYAQAIGGGAMAGAAIGSIVPVIGTAVGAAVGAAIGGLGALIVDNKQAISNGYNQLMGQPQDSRGTGRSAAVAADIGDAAMGKGIGAVSASFESGNKGVSTISGGVGDAGGQSYGTHQLSSKSGTMTAFLRSEQGSKYYNEFRGMQPGSEEFNKKYTEIAKNDGEGFANAQKDFITKTHFDPVADWFQKTYKLDLNQHSRALKEALYSVGVQYGPNGAKTLVKEAYDGMDVAKTDDSQLIQKLQDYRASSVMSKFQSSSGAVKQSVASRAKDENVALQKMLTNERSGQSGSGIGAVYSQQMMGVYGEQKGKAQSGNGTVGIMAAPMGGGMSGAGDEAGGGTAAAELSPADGALYNLGMKNTRPNDNTVNMSGLNAKFKKAWYTMVGDWVQNNGGGVVSVASAFRTRMEQEQLWVKYGRNTKRVARPGTSRHESGFAIDIDRRSAQSLESSGMFKKYGFHRPLSNEPWHIELIGAGKGGAGGGPETSAGAESPQVMQNAAVQEMEKAAESTVVKAEENTKDAIKQDAGATAAGTDAEVKPTGGTAEAGVETSSSGPDTSVSKERDANGEPLYGYDKDNNVATPKTGTEGRTPAQQAVYEQYLKTAGGDPRKIPDSISKGQTNPFAALNDPSVLTSPAVNGGTNPFNALGNAVEAGLMHPYGQNANAPSVGPVGIMAPAANAPLMTPLAAQTTNVNSGAVSTQPMKPTVAPIVSPESPASAEFYTNETPIAMKASSAPTQTMAMPVSTQAAPEKIVRQPYDSVQKVAIADAGAIGESGGGGVSSSGGSGAGGGGGAGQKNDTPQLDEIPAMLDDLGLIFINSGYL